MSKEFLEAASRGDIERVKELLKQGVNKDYSAPQSDENSEEYRKYPPGTTALILAAKNGHVDLVRYLLLFHLADVNNHHEDGPGSPSALDWAVAKRNLDMVKTLSSWCSRETLTKAIALAYNLENIEIINYFSSKFEHIIKDLNKQIAFKAFKACEVGDSKRLFFYIQAGVDINNIDQHGNNFLKIALQNGHVEVAKKLIESGIKPSGDELFILLDSNIDDLELTKKLLVILGPNVFIEKNKENLDAFSLAISKNKMKLANFLGKTESLGLAFKACEEGDSKQLFSYIESGVVNLNDSSLYGDTLLGVAIKFGQVEIVKELLNRGIKFSNTDLFDLPLIDDYAKKEKIVQLLSDAGVNLKSPYIEHQGLYEKAYGQGDKKFLDLLDETIQKQTSLKQAPLNDYEKFAVKCKLISESGHILGLSSSFVINDPFGKTLNYPSEANVRYSSLTILHDLVESYRKNLNKSNESDSEKYFNEISKSLEAALHLSDYQQGKLNFVDSGWDQHAIALLFYKDDYVVVNRGEGKSVQDSGISIYRLKDADMKSAIEEEMIKQLRYSAGKHSSQEILNKINGLAEKETSKIALKSKDQNHGTCSFVNPKASIQAALFMLKKEAVVKAKPNANEEEINNEAKTWAHVEYKKFTHFMRNEFVKKLIHGLNQSNDLEFIKLHKEILIAYIQQHHGAKARTEEKREGELGRIYNILYSIKDDAVRKEIMQHFQGEEELIFTAVQFGTPELVALLIANGANVNARSETGDTPLSIAQKCKRDDQIKLLIEKGAVVPVMALPPEALVTSYKLKRDADTVSPEKESKEEDERLRKGPPTF